MQLTKGTRAILSYFNSSHRAMQAVNELEAVGFHQIALDRIPKASMGESTYNSLGFPESEAYFGLGEPAMPNGMPALDSMENHDYMVTVTVPREHSEQALSILKKYARIVN
jgi:hypothetical protein